MCFILFEFQRQKAWHIVVQKIKISQQFALENTNWRMAVPYHTEHTNENRMTFVLMIYIVIY